MDHGELPPGPGMAHPPHRLAQEVGGAAGGVGPALAQPGHQHVAKSTAHEYLSFPCLLYPSNEGS